MKRSSSRTVIALLVAVLSIPLASQAILRSQEDEGAMLASISERQRIYAYQSGQRQILRRAYSRAIEDYRDRLKAGEKDATKPDINDPKSFQKFIDGAPKNVQAHSAASSVVRSGSAKSIDAAELSTKQRILLRNYTRAGSCPPTMEKVLPGFHALCRNIVGAEASDRLPDGFGNDLQMARPRSQLPKTIDARLEMLKQARSGSKRSGGVVPMRPKTNGN